MPDTASQLSFMARILLIEDNPDLAAGLRANLELEGHQIQVCADGTTALQQFKEFHPQLVILDIMLPGRDGFRLLADFRSHQQQMPILMLTARGEETDKVRALRGGADDYLTKPFGLMELLARVEALLRRSGSEQKPVEVLFEDITLDRNTRQVLESQKPIALTPKEYELLLALVEQPNQIQTRQALLRQVWGHQADIATRTVDTHIAELRRKLEPDPAQPQFLKTARGCGYWFKK